jgi:hypothetical protein
MRLPETTPDRTTRYSTSAARRLYGEPNDEQEPMATKRQTTMAKLQRERKVQEKRERKREKKAAVAAAKLAGTYDSSGPFEPAEHAETEEPEA